MAFYLIFINLCTFGLYGVDKYKAQHHFYRIPEAQLFLFAGIGGSIGAYLAMMVFHHKTRKLKFLVGIPILCILQILIFFLIT